MSLSTYVYWGTDAGWKTQKPKPDRPWLCKCLDDGHAVLQPPYRKNCPDCWAKRPY